ncbi:TPA: hypothetical protein NJY08_005002 [Salmonella enterica subsp. enterica serovar Typhi str. AG3]|nr:hypothetical protein [Salmonella enterica subsp. enterica serovar Typhi str. AG3]
MLDSMLDMVMLSSQHIDLAVGKEIYTSGKDNAFSKVLKEIIKMVGGIGGLLFTLSVLVIALCIMFASISPKNIGKWWTAFFSCLAGAVLFFSAYLLSGTISSLF